MRLIILLIIAFISFPDMFARSIVLDQTIELNVKSKKSFADFIFGGKKGEKITPFSMFRLNNSGYCIIDQVNSSVTIYTNKWKVVKRIKRIGKRNFVSPVCGTTDEDGSFYISDSFLREVVKFGSDFKFKSTFISDPEIRITGIYFFKNKLFAVDTGNHRILIFNRSGERVKNFGNRGNSDGEFNFPTHLFVDNKYIYVTDALNFRIQIFDHNGNFVSKFGKNGKFGGDFSKPKGIAVDSRNRIFVTDVMFDNVQVFDIKGRFLSYFGGPGSGKSKFWMPSGILIDKEDRIFVCDTYNHRIQIFKVSEEN